MKIDQCLPTLSNIDAIGNEALTIRSLVKSWGHDSNIYAEIHNKQTKSQVYPIRKLRDCDLLIYHHSIGSKTIKHITKVNGKKILIYHNITPDEYFWGTNIEIANLAKLGRQQLLDYRDCFDLALADSEYNRQELETMGYNNTHVLPLLLDFKKYEIQPDKKVVAKYDDDLVNILFVGKIAPHKNQDKIIRSFNLYNKAINPKSRLFLVGNSAGFDKYLSKLLSLKKRLAQDNIVITEDVNQAELIAYYKLADIFLCMSEHEGFCVPLVESMFFNVPIVAFNSTAIPATLNDSAIIFDTNDYLEVAELLNYVLSNKKIKDGVIAKQSKRLNDFKIDVISQKLRSILDSSL